MAGAVYAKVAGAWSKVFPPVPPPVPYNDATGGVVTEFDEVIARTNLCPDPSMETDLSSWVAPAAAAGTVEHSTEHAFVGTHSLKFTKVKDTATATRSVLLPAKPGTRYTMSASVFGAPGLQASVGIEYFDATGTAVPGGPGGQNERVTTDGATWQRAVVQSWSTPENVTQVKVRVSHPATNPAGAVLWFDAVVFEEGATDGSWFDGAEALTRTGRKMRAHTFADDGELTVIHGQRPFELLLVNGGVGYNDIGYLSPPNANWPQGIGCNGTSAEITVASLTEGAVPVVVGNGGPPGTASPGAVTVSSVGEHANEPSSGIVRDKTVPPITTAIRGVKEVFPSEGTGNIGAGGGASGTTSFPGQPGIVVVAYELEPPPPPVYNDATGGTVVEVANYLGTTETWRVHTIDTTTDLVINSADFPFNVLLIGGGSGAGGDSGSNNEGSWGGTGGQVVEQKGYTLPAGTLTAEVLPGGPGGWPGGTNYGGAVNLKQGDTVLLTAAGGQRGPSGPGNWPSTSNGADGTWSDVSGVNTQYAAGGGNKGGSQGAHTSPYGNGGNGSSGHPPYGGGTGALIVAYRIG